MTFENTWNQFVGGKIDYQNFSDHGWVMAVDASAETYDVVIGEKELLDNGEVDPAKIYRGLKATVPFSVVQYGVGEPVLVGYLNGDRNHPLVVGASDNIVMDVTKVTVNPFTPPLPDETLLFAFDPGKSFPTQKARLHVFTVGGIYVKTIETIDPFQVGDSPYQPIAINPSLQKYYARGYIKISPDKFTTIGIRDLATDTLEFSIEYPNGTTLRDMAIDFSTNNIYVSSTGYFGGYVHKVTCYDSAGNYLFDFANHGTAPGDMDGTSGPSWMDISGGYVYVRNASTSQIKKYDLSGNFINNLSFLVGVPFKMYEGNFVVTGITVKTYSESGVILSSFGGFGDGPGQFRNAGAIAIGNHGRIYVFDGTSTRPLKIQVFESDGTFINIFGGQGAGTGEFSPGQSLVSGMATF